MLLDNVISRMSKYRRSLYMRRLWRVIILDSINQTTGGVSAISASVENDNRTSRCTSQVVISAYTSDTAYTSDAAYTSDIADTWDATASI